MISKSRGSLCTFILGEALFYSEEVATAHPQSSANMTMAVGVMSEILQQMPTRACTRAVGDLIYPCNQFPSSAYSILSWCYVENKPIYHMNTSSCVESYKYHFSHFTIDFRTITYQAYKHGWHSDTTPSINHLKAHTSLVSWYVNGDLQYKLCSWFCFYSYAPRNKSSSWCVYAR